MAGRILTAVALLTGDAITGALGTAFVAKDVVEDAPDQVTVPPWSME